MQLLLVDYTVFNLFDTIAMSPNTTHFKTIQMQAIRLFF
jgi:hypothetical protein